jgi:protein gp37
MGENSKIAWTDHTFNPWHGCTKVSAGCAHCYAEAQAQRFGTAWGPTAERRLFGDKHWNEPIKWNRAAKEAGVRARVFCASMADVFEDRADLQDQRVRLWKLIAETPCLDWLLLTKRPDNIRRMLPTIEIGDEALPRFDNVWLGVTAENQRAADERIPLLLEAPAAVRFISMEPLLEKIDIERYVFEPSRCKVCRSSDIGYDPNPKDLPAANPERPTCLMGCTLTGEPGAERCNRCQSLEVELLSKLDWAIVGGESGPNARPCSVEWIRDIVQQCNGADVPVFVKQLGANPILAPWGVPRTPEGDPMLDEEQPKLRDRAGADPAEWPADVRVRQFPTNERTR